MQRHLTRRINGKEVKFTRTLGAWVHNFNRFGERPLGQEAIAFGATLEEAYLKARAHWEGTLRDGDPELREKRFQPQEVQP